MLEGIKINYEKMQFFPWCLCCDGIVDWLFCINYFLCIYLFTMYMCHKLVDLNMFKSWPKNKIDTSLELMYLNCLNCENWRGQVVSTRDLQWQDRLSGVSSTPVSCHLLFPFGKTLYPHCLVLGMDSRMIQLSTKLPVHRKNEKELHGEEECHDGHFCLPKFHWNSQHIGISLWNLMAKIIDWFR